MIGISQHVLLYGLNSAGQAVPLLVSSDGSISGGSGSVAWDSVTGKPSTFSPSTHESSHQPGGGSDPIRIPANSIIYHGGNIAYNNTSFTELSSSLRLAVPAVVGDILRVSLCAFVSNENQTLRFDIATIVSGSVVRRIANTSNGIGGMVCDQAVTQRAVGTIHLTCASGDLSGGNCTVSVVCSSTGTRTVVASANTTPLVFCVENLGS